MRYFATIGETEYECAIDQSNGALVIAIDGREYRVDLKHIPRSKIYTLLLDGLSYEFTLEEDDGLIECAGGAGLFHVRVEDARTHAARSKTAAARGTDGPKVVKAVMPGIVREVLAAPGDVVQAGQPLLILEAMKMQNEIRADRDGTVSKVHVAAEDTVEKGAALVDLE
ncbi:MAG: acyl-CoA carboxylase biotin carboxyl carrier protein subunit [Planctomycetota bacterium]